MAAGEITITANASVSFSIKIRIEYLVKDPGLL
jgi:hypothetical protein